MPELPDVEVFRRRLARTSLRCAGKLRRTKVSGRQTVFCPACQKKS